MQLKTTAILKYRIAIGFSLQFDGAYAGELTACCTTFNRKCLIFDEHVRLPELACSLDIHNRASLLVVLTVYYLNLLLQSLDLDHALPCMSVALVPGGSITAGDHDLRLFARWWS